MNPDSLFPLLLWLWLLGAGATAARAASPAAGAGVPDGLAAGFRSVPDSNRVQVSWVVPGPAWEEEEIEAQLIALKKAGVGGLTALFHYPVSPGSTPNPISYTPYLSAEFLNRLSFAARRSRELGLRFSLVAAGGFAPGGPTTRAEESPHRLRLETIVTTGDRHHYLLPALEPGEEYVAVFLEGMPIGFKGRGLELPNAGAGKVLQVFIAGPSFRFLPHPALGGEGYQLDPFNPQATARYLQESAAPLLQACSNRIDAIYLPPHDVIQANWTPDFLNQFQQLRGYPLGPSLPVLFGHDPVWTPQVRHDFWLTLLQLAENNLSQESTRWDSRARFIPSLPGSIPFFPGDTPSFLPSPNSNSWQSFSLLQLATTGPRLAPTELARQNCGSWNTAPFLLGNSLSDLKRLADLEFLAGATRAQSLLVPYSPRPVAAPGWLSHHGSTLNPANPQWPFAPALFDYVSRCQFLLGQGRAEVPVAVYLPLEDQLADTPPDAMPLRQGLLDHFFPTNSTRPTPLLKTLNDYGFNFEGIHALSVNRQGLGSRFSSKAGVPYYPIVILPGLRGINVAALEELARFCRAGGTLIATEQLPDRAYGFFHKPQSLRVRELVEELFGSPGNQVSRRSVGQGMAIYSPDTGVQLGGLLLRLHPDLWLEPRPPQVGFVHRALPDRDLYFLANTGTNHASFTAHFLGDKRKASAWDPVTGQMEPLARVKSGAPPNGDYTSARLDLPPHASTFVVLSKKDPGPVHPVHSWNSQAISAPWRLEFSGSNAPLPREVVRWRPWEMEPNTRTYSGQGTYSTSFSWPRPLPLHAWLQLPALQGAAEVLINGKNAGIVWTAPWQVEITPHLQAGNNTVSITVANTPLNSLHSRPLTRWIGDQAKLVYLYGQRVSFGAIPPLTTHSGLTNAPVLRWVEGGRGE